MRRSVIGGAHLDKICALEDAGMFCVDAVFCHELGWLSCKVGPAGNACAGQHLLLHKVHTPHELIHQADWSTPHACVYLQQQASSNASACQLCFLQLAQQSIVPHASLGPDNAFHRPILSQCIAKPYRLYSTTQPQLQRQSPGARGPLRTCLLFQEDPPQ